MMRGVLTTVIVAVVVGVAALSFGCAERDAEEGRAPSAEARRSDQAAYTQAFVQRAIDRYEADGLEDTLAHYRSVDSFDGQYYVFIVDESGTLIAHPSPEVDFQGVHLSEVRTTNEYPSGQMVLDAASVDGAWYVFIIDAETGRTVGHFRPEIRQRDPSERIDSTGYFYGDDLLSAGEEGKWIQIRFLNPETGEDEVKHVWAVHHNGHVFASGWYE